MLFTSWWGEVLSGLGGCISYFSIAVMKHHEKGSSQKKRFTWACISREINIYDGREDATSARYGGRCRKVRIHVLNHKHEAEKATGNGKGLLKTPRPLPVM